MTQFQAGGREFVHNAEEEVRSISGGYVWDKELRLKWQDREVLCLVGNATVDSSCCGVGGCRFAYIPGFILGFHVRQNEAGHWVSQVEPVPDTPERIELRRILEKRELVQQVRFA